MIFEGTKNQFFFGLELTRAGFGRYDAELIARGISKERIKHYGFAFEGKNVLIAQA